MANHSSWLRSRAAFWAAAALLPPLGVVLLWLRPRPGVLLKLLGSLSLALLLFLDLALFFGLRAELDGSTSRLVLSFGTQAARYAELEQHRADQGDHSPASPTTASEASWPRFRGPAGDGCVATEIPDRWQAAELPLLWRQPVGGGYSTFIVAGGTAFTIEQRREQEVVAAYDLRSGAERWTHAWDAHFRETMGGDGPRAAPAWDQGRLYALGATGELRALRAETGDLIWRRNILDENGANNLQWGMAAAPLIVDEKLIVLPGGSRERSVVAYDKLSGALIWAAQGDQQAYTSPMVVSLAGVRQLLVVSAERVMGLTVEDGTLLWDYPWATKYGVNAAQPLVVDDNRFFISAGYDHGAALVEITRDGDRLDTQTLWLNNRMKNRFSSSILHQGHIYGLDEGILACLDVETGERRWKGGRYGHGQLLLADGHLIVSTEKGQVALVQASPERFVEEAHFDAISGKTWNHPALAESVLLVRNHREMAAFSWPDRPPQPRRGEGT